VIGEQADVRRVVDLGDLLVQPPRHDAFTAGAEEHRREIALLAQ